MHICAPQVCPECNAIDVSPENVRANHAGLDNPAYNESPPDKRFRPPLTKHASLDTSGRNTHVTTVIVHREAPTRIVSDSEHVSSVLPELRCPFDPEFQSEGRSEKHETVIDIDKDIALFFTNKPNLNNEHICAPVLIRAKTIGTGHTHAPPLTSSDVGDTTVVHFYTNLAMYVWINGFL